MTDRERWGLRGPVLFCRLERTWYLRKCGAEECETLKHNDASSAEFRADGARIRIWSRSPNGSELTQSLDYDPVGKLVSARTESAAGVMSTKAYEYDSAGRLERVIACDKNGNERLVESYEYNSKGRKEKKFYFDTTVHGPNVAISYGVEGSGASYSATDAFSATTAYDELARPIGLLFHDSHSRLLRQIDFH